MFELKKTLVKQRGLIIIFVMIVLKVALTLANGYDSHYIINLNKVGYTSYINQYKGKLTEAKEKKIQAEYYAVGHATVELEELSRQLQSGQIEKTKYKKLSKTYYERQKNCAVFNVVYNQYYYSKQAPKERYIMDARGWNTLLCHNAPDFSLLLCLILVLTPIFCNEYESGMDVLLLSSKKGRYYLGIIKLCIGFFLAVVITYLFSFLEYICINSMVGLKNGEFPLKSLEYFQNSEYSISLNQAFLMTMLIRLLGALLLAILISTVGILSKKTLITLFVISVIVLIPYILSSGKSYMYYLPLPSGLLSATGYLWGTSYSTNINPKGILEKSIEYQKIDKKVFSYLVFGFCSEIGALILYSLKKYSRYNYKLVNFRMRITRIFKCLCITVISLVIFVGCTKTEMVKDCFTYNNNGEQYYGESKGYAIKLDAVLGSITAKNLKTGEKIILTRDPFERDSEIDAILVRDDWCYYLALTRGTDGMRIYGIDLKNFNEKLLYNSVKENTENFFGIVPKRTDMNDTFKDSNGVNCFFLNDDFIYYKRYSTLSKIDRKSLKETVLALGVEKGLSCAYHNRDIYFLDNQHRLNVYREKDGQVHAIDSVYTHKFTIKGDYVVYNSLLENNKIEYYKIK